AQRLPGRVALDLAAAVMPAHFTISTHDPMVEGERLVVLGRPLHARADSLPILGVHALEKRFQRRRAAAIEAVHPVELVRPHYLVARQVPFPAADVRDLLRFREASLAARE